MQTGTVNPYAAPMSDVRSVESGEYGSVKALSVSGRLGRVRYVAYSAALFLIVWLGGGFLSGLLIAVAAAAKLGNSVAMTVSILMMVLIYGTFIVGTFMLAIQRVHDFDTRGWITLLFLVPLVNVFFGFILWFIPGTRGENRFGKKTPPNGTGVKIMAVIAPVSFIMIIGVIAAIAIPTYQQYRIKAQQAVQSGH